MLTEADRRFLRQREQRNRRGRLVVPAALVVWLSLWIFLYVRIPLLANPLQVIDRLQRDQIMPGTVVTMASALPVAFTLFGVLLTILLILAWSRIRTERHLLRMMRSLDSEENDVQQEGWTL
jgi:hypothetical protein